MDSFKAPSLLPADLLLIQSLLGTVEQAKAQPVVVPKIEEEEDDINSSGSEYDSEDEIVDVLMVNDDENGPGAVPTAVSEALAGNPVEPEDSDSESSDESSDSEPENAPVKKEDFDNDLDEDADRGPAVQSQSYYTSQHEIVDSQIAIPDIEEVAVTETLEKIGEIASILDKLVIVKGVPSSTLDRSQNALDSDTLLVFEDRKVLGYIYETFGPTAQPFYQVKFNSVYPIDPEKVQTSRPVYHVPAKSRFIPLRELHRMRGSDASNVYDEEPADHELEFSDDEAEAEFKRNAKQARRGNREGSVASSSRHATPAPMTDAFGTNSVYDDLPYGIPSRPAPMPYDEDPYAEAYSVGYSEPAPSEPAVPVSPSNHVPEHHADQPRRPQYRDRRGRNRGRGRGRGGNGGQTFHAPPLSLAGSSHFGNTTGDFQAPYAPQLAFDSHQFNPNFPNWQFQAMVQPHINPRFFGMGYANQYPETHDHNQYWNPHWAPPGNGYNGSEPS